MELKHFIVIFLLLAIANAITTELIKSHPQPLIEDNSQEDEIFATSYVLPKQIYNDGIPYYVEKDAISGQFDFSSKKPAGIEPSVNEVIDPKEKIVLSSAAPNIHDILHLPVKYSSSKFVYPLVSSSYANLKYQGNNKNYISNNKIHLQRVNITKLQAQPNFSILKATAIPSISTTTKTTTQPITSTTRSSTTTHLTETSPTTQRTTSKPVVFETTTEKRKFIPTKKYHSSSSTTITTTSAYGMKTSSKNPVVFTTTTTTAQPTHQSTKSISFKPLPTSTQIPTLDPADVYNAIATEKSKIFKNNALNTISLAENQIPENESEIDHYSDSNDDQGLDAQGNLMQPLQPSKPSPFGFQTVGYTQTIPQPNGQAYQQGRPIEEQEYFNPRPQSYEPQLTGNEYVSLHVPKPNIPVPVNNVVISPGQNSASFVLGSHQQSGNNRFTNDKNGHPIQYGQVISEDISSIPRPQMMVQSPPVQESHIHGQVLPDSVNDLPKRTNSIGEQETKDVLVTTNFRFPDEEGQDKTKASENINGHAQPLSLHQLKNTVVFPDVKETIQPNVESNFKPPSKVIFENEKDQMIQQQEVLPLSQYNTMQQTKLKFPELSEGLTPPQEQPTSDPRPTDLNNRQGSVRSPPPGFKYVDLRKQQLPNILPQFRPNAKIGSGPPPFKDRKHSFPGSFPNRMLPPQLGAQRRTPIVHRHPVNQPQQEANRRIYRGPANVQNQYVDNRQMLFRRPQVMATSVKSLSLQHSAAVQDPSYTFSGKVNQPTYKGAERYAVERNTKHSIASTDSYPPETNMGSDRLAAFEEEDMMVNDPPKPTTITKKSDEPELEPVVTLQMLKTKKLMTGDSLNVDSNVPPKFDYEVIGPTQGLYVVYPHKTGTSKLQPEEIQVPSGDKPQESSTVFDGSSQGSDYQNTPFSVVREVKQEPILMAKPQKPLHQKAHEEFPYRLEKPSIQQLSNQAHDDIHDIGVFAEKVAIADTPIAIAYSPTESNPYRNSVQKKPINVKHQTQFSNPNSASQVIPEIRDENEYDTDSRGQNYEKDFQAPFYPSVSLNSATTNGWSYEVTGAPPSGPLDDIYIKNNINRSDNKGLNDEKVTKLIVGDESDTFSPQLQGGFKPIYPPGYKEDYENSDAILRVENSPTTEKAILTEDLSTLVTTTTSLSTTTEKSKTEKKKEPSLADILFGTVNDELDEIES